MPERLQALRTALAAEIGSGLALARGQHEALSRRIDVLDARLLALLPR